MHRYDRSRRQFAIILAGLAGFIDAVGFLSASGYFVSFMSGNTTRLGVALGTDPAQALLPALLIIGFLGGVTAGALTALRTGRLRRPAVLALVAVLLLAGAGARAVGSEWLMLLALVLAMGAINNTFQRGGEVTVGLTYMTGALVRWCGWAKALRYGWPEGPSLDGWHGVRCGLVCFAAQCWVLSCRAACRWSACGSLVAEQHSWRCWHLGFRRNPEQLFA